MEKIQEEKVDLDFSEPKVQDRKIEFLAGTITADEIENRKDKTFTIIGYGMRTLRSLDDESKQVEKLVLKVKLSDGTELDYFPNKTSQDTMRNKLGTRLMKDWLNKTFEWEVQKTMIAGTKRNVLYVRE